MKNAEPAARRPAKPAELLVLAAGGETGDRRSLARLLSIAEEGGAGSRELARLSYPLAGTSYSVGVTGAPGTGKSTLTASLVTEALEKQGGPVAVLAIDPTSPLSGGAILGDRVRMQDHALDRGVYIRSMATRGHLGGLAAAVPDAIRVFHATGWPLVLVETVGVGQVEVEVAASCDTVLVVVNPGWGDAVQANKAGLLEVADVLVINKADRPGARETKRDLVQMLQLAHGLAWVPPIVETVALDGGGVPELWAAVASHRSHLETGDGLERRRAARLLKETEILASARLTNSVVAELQRRCAQLLAELTARRVNPAEAADEVVAYVAADLLRSSAGNEAGNEDAANERTARGVASAPLGSR